MKLRLLLLLLSCLLWQPLLAASAPQAAHAGNGQHPESPASPCGAPRTKASAAAPKPKESPASKGDGAASAMQPSIPPPSQAKETAPLDPERGWFLAARISLLH